METERKKLTVGAGTHAYLKCLQQLNALWVNVYDALAFSLGNEDAERIMGEEYNNKNDVIRDFINEYMCMSISDNINHNHEFNNDEI